MQTPKVSVIVPVYNVSKYLEKCLSSIANQTLKDIEIILVNDCSPDPEDEQICRKFAANYDNIIYVAHKKNLGSGGARNTGIKLVKSEYIAFIDSDDYLEPEMLKSTYDTAIANNSDIVAFGYTNIDINENIISINLPNGKSNDNLLQSFLENKNTITPMVCDKLWKKSLFTNNNIFFPANVYFEDMMVVPQLLHYANSISFLMEAYYFYLQRDDSTVHTISEKHIDDAFFTYDYIASFLKSVDKYEKYNKLLEKRIMKMMQHHISISLNSRNQHDREVIIDYLAEKMTTDRPGDLKYYFPHRYYEV